MNDKWIKAIPPKMLHDKLGVYAAGYARRMASASPLASLEPISALLSMSH